MKRTDGQPADNMGDDVLKEETFIVHRSLALKPTDYKTKPRRIMVALSGLTSLALTNESTFPLYSSREETGLKNRGINARRCRHKRSKLCDGYLLSVVLLILAADSFHRERQRDNGAPFPPAPFIIWPVASLFIPAGK